jgi:hypothetical protein
MRIRLKAWVIERLFSTLIRPEKLLLSAETAIVKTSSRIEVLKVRAGFTS